MRAPRMCAGAALAMAVAAAGCAARLADDGFRLDELDARERALIEQERRQVQTGGSTALVAQPRFVYRNGAVVDTNRARWYWIAGGAVEPPGPRPATPGAGPDAVDQAVPGASP